MGDPATDTVRGRQGIAHRAVTPGTVRPSPRGAGEPSLIGAAPAKLRLVVFTRGSLLPVNRVLFERLAADPLLDVRGIVVDSENLRRPVAVDLAWGRPAAAWRWAAFKIIATVAAWLREAVLLMFDAVHPRAGTDAGYGDVGRRTGVPIHHVANSDQCLPLIRSLRPQLGVVVDGRVPGDAVASLPQYGTLNIHKGSRPDSSGSVPVGYWEVLAGEPTIAVTIQYATPVADAAPVLAETTIAIEECDTLESLQIKADVVGANLYHETLQRFARGDRRGKPPHAAEKARGRFPGEVDVHRVRTRLRRRAVQRMPAMRGRPSWAAKMRLLIQYAALLPALLWLKKRFVKHHQAPIGILFYHVVANRPVNHICLPLEEFVRQIEFLRRYHDVIPLEEGVRRVRSGSNDRLGVAITFDDGYADNCWAIEYLRYFGIPASFFISIGHVRDGSHFEHDRSAGFMEATPMRATEFRELADEGFLIGSHGLYHEDFGQLDAEACERVLRESRRLIEETMSRVPEHFAFPIGQRQENITPTSFELAQKYYRYVYSAYGGYNFPRSGRTHFLRTGHPLNVLELAMIMDGYTGFRNVLIGNAWGIKTDMVPPYWVPARPLMRSE